jgi:alkylation response protein AidB-like acyl-CoA dehydrogenase
MIDRLGRRPESALSDGDLERLGWLVTELEVERLMGLRLATMADRGESATVSASIAKVFGSELAQHVARWCAEVLGAEAQFAESADRLAADAEAAVRAHTALTVIGGTSEIQRNTVATRGLGLPKGT